MKLLDIFKQSKIESEVLECYQNKFPEQIFVTIHPDNNNYWAEIKLNDETLFTQASSRTELENNVNHAIACYFDVKKEYIPYLLINKKYSDPELNKRKESLKIA